MLNEEEQRQLLALARQSLEARVTRGPSPEPVCAGPFAQRRGVFVSIHRGDDLRGCLGRLTCDAPLGHTVVHLGSAVADSDPRFAAVAADELPSLHIEISVLTRERPVSSIEDIEIGRHGLIVEHGSARGLLLPQVAIEHGLDRESFLDHTCLKAGLPADAWHRGARILVFEAQVFSERALIAS